METTTSCRGAPDENQRVYDGLNQLTWAEGTYRDESFGSVGFESSYTQDFAYDKLGNMTGKESSVSDVRGTRSGADLDYNLTYEYWDDRPHLAKRIGDLYYLYDKNGNVVEERRGGHSTYDPATGSTIWQEGDLRGTSEGFALDRGGSGEEDSTYQRHFTWDWENRMTRVTEGEKVTRFAYDAGGERTVKKSSAGETLYFDSLCSLLMTSANDNRISKHIKGSPLWWVSPRHFASQNAEVGETRIATRLNHVDNGTPLEELADGQGDSQYTNWEKTNLYFYHSDHLGSAQIVTDTHGEVYEHMEYTPYGELWIEDVEESLDKIPFRFTGQEWDEETGLYYHSARYMNPKSSRWMKLDPAGFDLINPINGEGKPKQNYSMIESLNWTSYCSNNPVRAVDPTGLDDGRLLQGAKNTLQNMDIKKAAIGTLKVVGGATEIIAGVSLAGGSVGAAAVGGGYMVVDGGFRIIDGLADITDSINMTKNASNVVPDNPVGAVGKAVDLARGVPVDEAGTVQEVSEFVGDAVMIGVNVNAAKNSANTVGSYLEGAASVEAAAAATISGSAAAADAVNDVQDTVNRLK